jgi:hypothetical protein
VTIAPDGHKTSTMARPELEAIRTGVPAARGLPLLAAIAARGSGTVAIPYLGASVVAVDIEPC